MRRAVRMGQLIGLLTLIACGDMEANPTAVHCSAAVPCPDALICYRAFCVEGDELPSDLEDAGLNYSEAPSALADAGQADAAPTGPTGASSPVPMSSDAGAARPPMPPATTTPAPMPVADAGVRPAPADAGATKPSAPSVEELVQCLGSCTLGNLLDTLLETEACQRCVERVRERCNPSGRGNDDANARRCRNER